MRSRSPYMRITALIALHGRYRAAAAWASSRSNDTRAQILVRRGSAVYARLCEIVLRMTEGGAA